MKITNYTNEVESQQYQACTFELDEQKIICRTAKITPIKVGQFVTLWKRNLLGKTCPFNNEDDLDFIIINCQFGENSGYFKFPKAILITKGIISTSDKVGKMGMRVYPSWDKGNNSQALKTQKWQLDYFVSGKEFMQYKN
jgi:hypothetical protein